MRYPHELQLSLYASRTLLRPSEDAALVPRRRHALPSLPLPLFKEVRLWQAGGAEPAMLPGESVLRYRVRQIDDLWLPPLREALP